MHKSIFLPKSLSKLSFNFKNSFESKMGLKALKDFLNFFLYFGGQYVTPPKKSKPVVYSTKSLGKIENFEIYDFNYNRDCKKLWTKLVIEIGQGRSIKSLNEWEKMLIKKFGKLIYKA